jgi:hypothetical protein
MVLWLILHPVPWSPRDGGLEVLDMEMEQNKFFYRLMAQVFRSDPRYSPDDIADSTQSYNAVTIEEEWDEVPNKLVSVFVEIPMEDGSTYRTDTFEVSDLDPLVFGLEDGEAIRCIEVIPKEGDPTFRIVKGRADRRNWTWVILAALASLLLLMLTL